MALFPEFGGLHVFWVTGRFLLIHVPFFVWLIREKKCFVDLSRILSAAIDEYRCFFFGGENCL